MSLNGRQFTLPGMEHLAPEPETSPSLTERWQEGVRPRTAQDRAWEAAMGRSTIRQPRSEHLLASAAQGRLGASQRAQRVGRGTPRRTEAPDAAWAAPVGMRGSLGEREARGIAHEHKAASDNRWESLRMRTTDDQLGTPRDRGEDYDPDFDDPWADFSPHPRTGLPRMGEIDVEVWHPDNYEERPPGIGFRRVSSRSVPDAFSFQAPGSVSGWNSIGKVEYVPVPQLQTVQGTVSSQRLHQAIENPETRSNPRLEAVGERGRELPRVFTTNLPGRPTAKDTYTVVDGNHRLSADLLQGKLFSEARVMRPSDEDRMTAHTIRHSILEKRARAKIGDEGVAAVRERMARNYGLDDY